MTIRKPDVFAYEPTLGEIDVRITYEVTGWGRPARINYNEHDYPAEGPEIDVIHVEMLNAPKSGSKAVYIDAWDWLFDKACKWADEHGDFLVSVARLELGERQDANDEAAYDARRGV